MASDSGNRGGFDGDFDDSDLESRSDQDRAEVEKSGGLPYRIQFAPDYVVWNEARRLVSDRNGRVEDLATCCSQDPIIVMELLKVANAMFFSGGRQSITSAKAAIVRLGSDVVLDTLTRLTERPNIEDAEVKHWVENHRSRCRRASIVARMISESVSKTLSDDCQSATLFLYFGEMVAAAHFGDVYVKLAEQLQRSALIYRLAQDHKYDVEKIGLNYLRRNGIPEGLLFAIDRDSSSKSRDRAIMKPVSFAAGEMIEAFDVNRWEKLAPGKTLPPKSFIRVLQINEQQYLKLYERVAEYLYAYRSTEEQ